MIRTEFGTFPRQVSGYSLEHLLPENGRNLAKALVGTEGTLGVITDATVQLVRISPARMLVVLGYPDMPTAADAVPALLAHSPHAIEGLDARLVDVVRHAKGAKPVPDLPRGAGWLMIEVGGETPRRGAGRGRGVGAGCRRARLHGAPGRPDRHRDVADPGRRCRAGRAAPRTGGRPGPAGRTPPCHRRTWARTCASSRR